MWILQAVVNASAAYVNAAVWTRSLAPAAVAPCPVFAVATDVQRRKRDRSGSEEVWSL